MTRPHAAHHEFERKIHALALVLHVTFNAAVERRKALQIFRDDEARRRIDLRDRLHRKQHRERFMRDEAAERRVVAAPRKPIAVER